MAGDDAAAHTLAVPLTLPHAVAPAALHACMGLRVEVSGRHEIVPEVCRDLS